jgi:hypothetical protein
MKNQKKESIHALHYPCHVSITMEKSHQYVDANTQRLLWLEGETCPLGIDCNKRPSLT